jgi:hypothetical protein
VVLVDDEEVLKLGGELCDDGEEVDMEVRGVDVVKEVLEAILVLVEAEEVDVDETEELVVVGPCARRA